MKRFSMFLFCAASAACAGAWADEKAEDQLRIINAGRDRVIANLDKAITHDFAAETEFERVLSLYGPAKAAYDDLQNRIDECSSKCELLKKHRADMTSRIIEAEDRLSVAEKNLRDRTDIRDDERKKIPVDVVARARAEADYLVAAEAFTKAKQRLDAAMSHAGAIRAYLVKRYEMELRMKPNLEMFLTETIDEYERDIEVMKNELAMLTPAYDRALVRIKAAEENLERKHMLLNGNQMSAEAIMQTKALENLRNVLGERLSSISTKLSEIVLESKEAAEERTKLLNKILAKPEDPKVVPAAQQASQMLYQLPPPMSGCGYRSQYSPCSNGSCNWKTVRCGR